MAVAPLSAAEYADTEVATNVCLEVTQPLSESDNLRFFDISLSLVATPTNNVEIAFGVDTDGDGVLGRCERDFVLGWDCGAWFLRDRRAKTRSRSCVRRRLDVRQGVLINYCSVNHGFVNGGLRNGVL